MPISVEIAESICSISIRLPEKRNCIDPQTAQEIADALHGADNDDSVRAIILRGTQGLFSAGEDLRASDEREKHLPAFEHMIETADQVKKPLLAAVSGPAVGLAVTLLMCCDLVYCGRRSLFSLPFTALGEVPLFAVGARLTSECGYRLAAEKLLLSEPISAEQALSMHLVNGIFDDEEVLQQVTARALRLTRLPPQAVIRTKALLKATSRQAMIPQAEAERKAFQDQSRLPEFSEAKKAFLEGRMPDFSPKR